jgi:ribose 5-phosphate isomerase B
MRLAVSADHAAVELRRYVLAHLRDAGHDVTDLGIDDPDEPDDYPDRAADLGREVADGRAEVGILLCGSGAGACIAANKLRGVRAATCHDTFSAHQCREDDDANILCLGARVVGPSLALELIDTFLNARFSGLERHQRRLDKVLALEAAATV